MTELAVGQVVQLATGQKAVIRFIGETAFSSGEWVGVELEEPTGKNDGSVKGDRYFDCEMGFGMFVRPQTMSVIQQAPPPAAKPAPAKKPVARPSSLMTTSRAPAASDVALSRRKSLNAPSPSPVPRNPRPSSIARVSCSFHVPKPMIGDPC
jgi:dynactin 1